MSVQVDVQELVRRMIKYLIEGLAIAVAAYVLPAKGLSGNEVAMMALVGAATMAVLDTWSPAVAGGARHGAGFGIGSSLVGGLNLGNDRPRSPSA